MPQGEQRQAFVLVLHGVVIGFQEIFARDLAVRVVEVPHHCLGIVRRLAKRCTGTQLTHAQHVHDQDTVMRHRGATRLTHQRRRRDPGLFTHLHDGIHHIVGVFLQCVVNGRREIGL